ncbi:MAG: type II CAAX endopeptidase family protein [Leptotrichiaceae bacterium]|nr:type II CAAX endopeptidase family protein [Leptotrichiaceae bacterium]
MAWRKIEKLGNISIFLFIISFLNVIFVFILRKLIINSRINSIITIHKLISYLLDIPIIYYFIRNNKNKKYFIKKEKIGIKNFVNYYSLMFFIGLLINIISVMPKIIMENKKSDILYDYSSYNINIIIFSVIIIAPIIEELMFRGVIMNDLKEYGYKSAVIINSVLFGLSHIEISKVIMTTLLGIIFSYVAYRYSLKCSILLHVIWNLNSGIGTIFYFNKIPEEILILSMGGLSLVLFLIFIIGIIKRKYTDIFFMFKFNKRDKENTILFLKNNIIFLFIIMIMFFLNNYYWYL